MFFFRHIKLLQTPGLLCSITYHIKLLYHKAFFYLHLDFKTYDMVNTMVNTVWPKS